jgi:hypothetical protein
VLAETVKLVIACAGEAITGNKPRSRMAHSIADRMRFILLPPNLFIFYFSEETALTVTITILTHVLSARVSLPAATGATEQKPLET